MRHNDRREEKNSLRGGSRIVMGHEEGGENPQQAFKKLVCKKRDDLWRVSLKKPDEGDQRRNGFGKKRFGTSES